jgi:hypothetical protein
MKSVRAFLIGDAAAPAPGFGDLRKMFVAGAVEHPDRRTGRQPHHPKQVMRLRLVQPNRLPLGDALA